MGKIAEKTAFETIRSKTDKYILGTYSRYETAFEYGVGDLLFDTDGKQYIDFFSGVAVTNLGHGEADLIDAIRNQADRVMHTSNLYYSEPQANLAEVIIENSFPGKVFFCNSGTEANEGALKLARKYAQKRNISDPVILSLKGSFHGRTTGSMVMTGQPKIREGFGDLMPGFDYIQENSIDDLESKFAKYEGRIAGLIMEPILGEFGVLPLSEDFLNSARKLTQDHKALLIFDEIQTGMGRTGKLFFFQHLNFTPDVMTLAKGLGSGFPIGAVVIGEKFTDILGAGIHGSTFGGNHLAAAAAFETFRIILGRELLENVPALSEYMFRNLRAIQVKYGKLIKEVRGKGLHIGVVLSVPSKQVALECLKKGLVVNSTNENVIRMMPPLIVSIERIHEALQIFEEVIAGVQV